MHRNRGNQRHRAYDFILFTQYINILNLQCWRVGASTWTHTAPFCPYLFQGAGSGLSSLLPQPKNLTIKEIDRPLIPHALTKRQEPKGPKPGTTQGLLGSSASPSAIKAAAKSAALQLAKQIASDDQDNEEDITPQNYFSLGESSQPLPAVIPSLDSDPGAPTELAPFSPADEPGQSDAPLDFGGNHEGVGAWGGQYPQYQQPTADPESFPLVIMTNTVP